MTQFTNDNRHKGVRRGRRSHAALFPILLCFFSILAANSAAFFAPTPRVSAAHVDAPVSQAEATPTVVVPAPVLTSAAPVPVSSAEVPSFVGTGVPNTNQNATDQSPSDANPGNQQTLPPQPQAQPNAPAPSGGFPWLVVIPLVLLALAGVILLVLRTGRARPATAAVSPTAQVRAPDVTVSPPVVPIVAATPLDVSPVTLAEGPAVAATTPVDVSLAPAVASTGAAGVAGAASPPPATLECPNCGTANDLSENFCHECGQDLRPLKGATPAAAPADEVDEYTPYLETLNRVDEQLEYVLSRPNVTIGTAPNNDIVLDPSFRDYGTVSKVHAGLRRHDGGFIIFDRGSERGTFVNGIRISENPLRDNDQISLGDVRFIYHAPPRP